MKILYVSGFSLQGTSGKNRATRQKLEALSRVVDHLDTVAPSRQTGNLFLKGMLLVCAEMNAVYLILKKRAYYDYLVSRGLSGFLSFPIAKLFQIKVGREVHADPREEVDLISENFAMRVLLKINAIIDTWMTGHADIRICNHPDILNSLIKKGLANGKDFFVYNGASPDSASSLSKREARNELCFDHDKIILAFVGSVSLWHGVDYLVSLQQHFDRNHDNIQIVCGGGEIASRVDPNKVLINLTPLDDKGCAKLIRAADICLLPVKPVRTSPGSPLKLYDYIVNERPVVTQENTPGYSDEVTYYKVGIAVDFSAPDRARRDIIDHLRSGLLDIEQSVYRNAIEQVSWKSRMQQWVYHLKTNSL